MTRTVKILNCEYVVKGGGKFIYNRDVVANNIEEATAELSKLHGKKGCAVVLATTEKRAVYEMDDDFFFTNATLVKVEEVTD